MGAGGKYEVKIAPPVISQVIDKLEETRSTNEYDSDEEYETEGEDGDENSMKVKTVRERL